MSQPYGASLIAGPDHAVALLVIREPRLGTDVAIVVVTHGTKDLAVEVEWITQSSTPSSTALS